MKQQKRGAGISIKNRIFLILTLSIVAMSMMLLFAARAVTRSTVEKYLYEYLYATQAEMGNSMEVLFDEVGSVSARLENSARLRSLLDSNEAASKNQKEFAALMDRLDIDETAVGHVVAISRNGSTYASEEDGLVVEPPDNWYLETLSASDYSGAPFVDWNHVRKDTRGNAYLLYGKTVKDTYDGLGETLGYIILYIPESALEKRYSRLDESVGYSYLLASNDVVISHEDTAAIGSRQIDSRKYDTDIPFASFNDRINGVDSIVTVSRLDRHEYSGESILKGSGWRIVSVVSREMLVEPLNRINKTIALLALAALTASVLVTGRIARGITRPIRSMGRRLKSFGRQDAPEEVLLFEENRRDEMWELESAYNDMLLRITELMEKNRRQSEQTRKQELTALQAQINPHFLYNTLDVVAWPAKIKKQPEIEQLILALELFPHQPAQGRAVYPRFGGDRAAAQLCNDRKNPLSRQDQHRIPGGSGYYGLLYDEDRVAAARRKCDQARPVAARRRRAYPGRRPKRRGGGSPFRSARRRCRLRGARKLPGKGLRRRAARGRLRPAERARAHPPFLRGGLRAQHPERTRRGHRGARADTGTPSGAGGDRVTAGVTIPSVPRATRAALQCSARGPEK